jgi:hypothetical protein
VSRSTLCRTAIESAVSLVIFCNGVAGWWV